MHYLSSEEKKMMKEKRNMTVSLSSEGNLIHVSERKQKYERKYQPGSASL